MKISIWHIAGSYLFCFVLIAMLTVTGALDIQELRRYFTIPGNYHRLNLLPLQRGYAEFSYDNIMNFCLFIPLGTLLPMLWQSCRHIIKVVFTGFCFSLAIELSQWFNYRATDIDDVIMNTLGTAAGYLLYTLLLCRLLTPVMHRCCLTKDSHTRNILLRHESTCYIFMAWLFHFFLKPLLRYHV